MNNELIAILDYLERDRGLDREVLTQLIEESLVSAARRAVGPATDLRVHLDPKTGDIAAIAKMEVVKRVDYPEREIDLRQARAKHPDAAIGDELDWEVTPQNFGRIAAQTAKQSIMQRLRQAEKSQIQEEYKTQIGTLLNGSVTQFDRGEIIVSFGRAEGLLTYRERAPQEEFQVGDHISCVLTDVNSNRHGPVLIVSRSSPLLVTRLFEREVAEIDEGIVEIKGVAREPGYRSKIAVHSNDSSVDPVGACVGMRGSRVKAVVRELNGEKVDIIRWDPDVSKYITNAVQPAEIKALEIDEETKRVRLIVNQDQLSLAIGKRGQNARLTAKLTGWKIDIQKSEDQKEIDFAAKVKEAVKHLAELPEISEELAGKLVNNGFISVDGLKAAEVSDIAAIDGIDEDEAKKIKDAVSE